MNKSKNYKTETILFRDRWIKFVYHLQEKICSELEIEDGKAKFSNDEWLRAEGRGGGGLTRVMSNGDVFEKAGVNVSSVYGLITDKMRKHLGLEGSKWFACGLSLVLHPKNPYVPTTHANWRYFELYDDTDHVSDRWFGGGADLTPNYLFEEDAAFFHRTLKDSMDPFGPHLYPRYKKICDEYFSNAHRNGEMRGIGGVFYDHLRIDQENSEENLFNFQEAVAGAFLEAYLPILRKRRGYSYGDREIRWQEIRRGRYVEFNLIHDKGTLFGLKTNGRTESILMSLPPRARWEYNYHPEPGSEEEKLLMACRHSRSWA
ncbi:MAG: oxygen-dependent coproporphyrinogen oxidase [Chitinophagales bacterium]